VPRQFVVCLLSVTLVHRRLKFSAIGGPISTPFGTLAISSHPRIFYGDHPRVTPPLWELNTRGLAKCDFGPIEGSGCISETMQDRSEVSINKEVVYELLICTKIGDLE